MRTPSASIRREGHLPVFREKWSYRPDRQPGIRLRNKGTPGHAPHRAEDFMDSVNTQSAIGADYVGTHRIQGNGRSLRRCPENAPAIVIKSHHCNNGYGGGYFPDSDDRSPNFLDVEEGFKGDEVRSCLDKGLCLFSKEGCHCIEGEVADRFDKFSGRTNGCRDIGGLSNSISRNFNTGPVYFPKAPFQPVVGEFFAVSAKGVGDDNVCPCLTVSTMHAGNHFGQREVEFFRRLARFESPFLEHGSHGAVQYENSFADGFQKRGFHLSFPPGVELMADCLSADVLCGPLSWCFSS
jgi:hypothetical protein